MNNKDIFDIVLAMKVRGGGSVTVLEDKTVTPDFSNGDVTVSPDEGYDALSSVTIEKDPDLIAGNIKKDVNVFGITGTLESGGGSDDVINSLLARTTVNFKNSTATAVQSFSFANYNLLEYLDFNNIDGFPDCRGCSKLGIIVLRKSLITPLSSVGKLNSTPFAQNNAGGTLYVPQRLIQDYQSNVGWGYIFNNNPNNQIKAIEGSIYE